MIILFFGTLERAFCQNPVLKKYTIDDGLPSNEVYHIMQDKKGYIWVSTSKGAARFDGNRFEVFTVENGLPDNEVLKSVEDLSGRIWFISFTGPLTYYSDGYIHNSNNTNFLKDLELMNTVVTFTPLSDGSIIISPNWYSSLLLIDTVLSPYDFRNYHNLISHDNQKVFMLGGTKAESTEINDHEPFSSYKNDTIVVTDSGNYLIQNKHSFLIDNSKFNLNWNRSLVKLDKEGFYWHSNAQGLLRYKMKSNGSIAVSQKYFDGIKVDDLFQDKDFNFWIATKGEGLYMIPSLHSVLYNKTSGLADNNVTTAIRSENKILCGTLNGVLQTIENNKIVESKDLHANSIRKIMKDKDNNTYFLCDLDLYKNNTSSTKNIKSNTRYKSMSFGTSGELLVGGINKIFKYADDKIEPFFIKKIGLRYYAILEQKAGTIWLGTEHGVYILENDSIRPFHHELKPFRGWIDDICMSKDHRILITTRDSGLAIITNQKIEFISTSDGLQSNTCSSLFSDTLSGAVYIGMEKGLSVINIEPNGSVKIKNYNASNGLICGSIYSVFESGGEILLSTNKGLLVFKENDLNTRIETPKVYITALNINSKNIPLKDTLILKHNENNFRISFNGISFRDPKTLEYRYRLFPVDTCWNVTLSNNVVYPDLASGTYHFSVEVRTGKGIWSTENATISFVINKPFWSTSWFLFLLFSFLLVSGWSIFRYRIFQAQKKHSITNALLQTELKALRAQINPHFIFNSINSIQDFIFTNEPEEANEYLSKFAILMRMILQNSEKKTITLQEEIEFLQIYLQLENLRYSDKFDYEIVVEENMDTDDLFLPPMLLQLYIENAIIHGLSRLANKGKLIIDFKSANNYLICTIKDNGIGRKKSAEKRMNANLYQHKSFGMNTTNDRIQAINKSGTVKIEFQIIDLMDAEGNACGTEIILKFPQ